MARVQGSRENKFKHVHRAFKPVGISNGSEDFSQEKTVLWRYWKESARTQLTSWHSELHFLSLPGIQGFIAALKMRKSESVSRGIQTRAPVFTNKEFAMLSTWGLNDSVALPAREEQVAEVANGGPGFGWAAKPIKTAEPRQWQYFGMCLQWSKWPYISFYVFIFLYVYSHLNGLACFLVMPAKPDLFYLALPSNFLACQLLQGKMAGRGVFGLSWDVVPFFLLQS